MFESKKLREGFKFCKRPFIFSISFLLLFTIVNILDVRFFMRLFLILNAPVMNTLYGASLSFWNNILALYVLSFFYWFFVVLIFNILEARYYKYSWLIIPVLLLITFIFLLPLLGEAREPSRRIACMSNLKQIGIALKQYADDYNGFYPDMNEFGGFETLRKNAYLTDYLIYICPSDETKQYGVEKTEGIGKRTVSYHYKGGEKCSGRNNNPVAWDRYKNHNNKNERSSPLFRMKNYGNVLLANGSVIHYEGEAWEKFCEENMLNK